MDMDSRQPDAPMGEEELEEGEEIEITRDQLVAALQEVVTNLSDGLKGPDRETYLTADDLAQNDWFFAGVSDQPGQYAITMWPAEGDEDMLRIDIGGEDEVHALAADSGQVAELTDEFIEGMEEDYEDEYEEYDEEEEEEEEEEEDELEDEEEFDEEEEEEGISQNGSTPGR